MKHSEEYNAFTKLFDKVISVPRSEIIRREEAYKEASKVNPKRRGPKPKTTKPSASDHD